MSGSKTVPFQPKLDANEWHFCLPQLRAVINLTLSMRIVHQRVSIVWGMRIDQVNWITAHNYGEPKWHFFSPSLSWKAKKKKMGLDIASQNVPYRKQTTEQKLLILVSFCSGEVTSYTDISYCIHILWEVSRSVFSGPLCIEALILILEKDLKCRYDLIIGPLLLPSQVLFMLGNRHKSDGAKSGECEEWSTSSKPPSSTAAIATTDLCAGALS